MFKRAINNHNLHHSSINTSASFYCMVVIRARVTDENEVTPQSDYVIIYHNGKCNWQPRFDLSAAHCSVDLTWFPFDAQTCNLVFESWILKDDELNITIIRSRDIYQYFLASDEWDLTCAYNWDTCCSLIQCDFIKNLFVTGSSATATAIHLLVN